MRVQRFDSAQAVARAAAEIVASTVAADPRTLLGLPTGRTMVPMYAELRRRHRAGTLDLSEARAFNLDELWLPPEHPGTFRAYMERHAWERIGLQRARCAIPKLTPDTMEDPAAECRRYEALLHQAGGLDLAILGVGADGHVAYNLPGPAVEATHLVTLPETLADQLAVPADWRPLRAITLGLGSLRRARRLLLLATSTEKTAAVRALFDGPEDPQWPCSLLRRHENFEILVDAAAASQVNS